MRDKCTELTRTIEHYEELSCWVAYKPALEGMLIAKYKADKKVLHPDR